MSDTDETTANPKVEEAVEAFDVAEWLSLSTSPKDSVVIYNDGEALRNLTKLQNHVDQMAVLKEEERRELTASIADEPDAAHLDENVQAEMESMRARLRKASLRFFLEGIPPKESDLIDKKVTRAFKDREDADGKKGAEHSEYGEALADAYLSRAILRAENSDGVVVKGKWTPEEVHSLRFNEETMRGLPGNEFGRLEKQCVDLIYMRYDVDKIIDQDF